MKKLLSIVNDEYSLNKLGKTKEELEDLLKKTRTDGFEILKTEEYKEGIFPPGTIIGRHLWFYPMWMDLWLGDQKNLLRDFNSLENAKNYYGSLSPKDFTKRLRDEFLDAEKDQVEYVVMHVSHMSIEEAYTYKYRYKSKEIIKAFVALVNGALEGIKVNFTLLLENNWYPGLDLLDRDIVKELLEGIKYDKTRLLLDTGHLVNTNRSIKNFDEALIYMNKLIGNLKDLSSYIEGIHLNITFSGSYALKMEEEYSYNEDEGYEEKIKNAMIHVGKIDKHGLFSDNRIRDFINLLNIKWLVFELNYTDRDDLIKKVNIQNSFLAP